VRHEWKFRFRNTSRSTGAGPPERDGGRPATWHLREARSEEQETAAPSRSVESVPARDWDERKRSSHPATHEGRTIPERELLSAVVEQIVVESRGCIQPYFTGAPGEKVWVASRSWGVGL
jgi:hypothetical protein